MSAHKPLPTLLPELLKSPHLFNAQLVERVLHDLVVVDHVIFVLGVEVHLRASQAVSSRCNKCTPTTTTVSASAVPSSWALCWGREHPAAGRLRHRLQSAHNNKKRDRMSCKLQGRGRQMVN